MSSVPSRPEPLNKQRFANFDAIRIWGAIAVIYSHSFPAAEGHEDNELFQWLFGETFGMFFIYMFFTMSGFLITRSWFDSAGLRQYAVKRFLRIYPGYAASVIVVAAVVAPFGYEWWEYRSYYTDPAVIQATVETLLFLNDHDLFIIPDVVLYPDSNYMGPILNAVYWTIKVEMQMYAIIALLGVLRILRIELVAVLAVVGYISHLFDLYIYLDLRDALGVSGPYEKYAILDFWPLSWAAPGFFGGAFMYFFTKHHKLSGKLAAILFTVALATFVVDWSWILPPQASSMRWFSLLSVYPVVWFGHSDAPSVGNWTRYGDFSYGLYVFGWPVQQSIRALVGPGLNGYEFFAICIWPALFVAYCSWTLVEKRALKLKPGGSKKDKTPPEQPPLVPPAGPLPATA